MHKGFPSQLARQVALDHRSGGDPAIRLGIDADLVTVRCSCAILTRVRCCRVALARGECAAILHLDPPPHRAAGQRGAA